MFLVGVWELRRWRPAPYPWPPAVGDQRRARLHIGAHDVSTQTLHPQWSGYGYTWRRDLNSVREQQFARGPASREWLSSPFNALIERSRAGEKNPWLRRRLELGPDQRDFPALVDFYEAGATDYLRLAFAFGEAGDPSHGTGVVCSVGDNCAHGQSERITLLRHCYLAIPSLID